MFRGVLVTYVWDWTVGMIGREISIKNTSTETRNTLAGFRRDFSISEELQYVYLRIMHMENIEHRELYSLCGPVTEVVFTRGVTYLL